MFFLLQFYIIIVKRSQFRKKIQKFYLLSRSKMANQGLLLNVESLTERNVSWDMVKANFVEMGNNQYQVFLEVSTNKFLLNVSKDDYGMESFEVVAIKWFVELTTRVLALLKKLVNHLWNMID